MFGSSLPPVVCRRDHVLFTLCSVRLYLQLFVGGLMSYLRYLSLFGYSCVNTLMLCLCFVFLRLVHFVASSSGLSICDCLFGVL
jgi:hypothetical protein